MTEMLLTVPTGVVETATVEDDDPGPTDEVPAEPGGTSGFRGVSTSGAR